MSMKKQQRYQPHPTIEVEKIYFKLENKVHPGFHENSGYDYIIPLWKMAWKLYKLKKKCSKLA